MENIRKNFVEREKKNKEEFENFLLKNKGNQYITNLYVLKFKLYH